MIICMRFGKMGLKFIADRRFKILQNSSKCSNCEHAGICQGGGWHTWDFEKKEPRICMMENIVDSHALR